MQLARTAAAPDVEGRIKDASFNDEIASQFCRAADLLQVQGADGHRIRAYRRAADSLHYLKVPASEIYRQKGIGGLVAIPTIGEALAQAIADVVDFGSWRWLDRLSGSVDPESVLCTVAGIGPSLAARIHDQLGVESLEDLELAANDGRLGKVRGFGPRRVQAVAESLAGRLRYGVRATFSDRPERPGQSASLPSAEELLDVDREYRERAGRGELALLTPKRFNPDKLAWLPILHTTRGDRHYSAMYSNTAKAHQLGRTRDWVVIYRDDAQGGQWTAVTSSRPTLAAGRGSRVIKGPVAAT